MLARLYREERSALCTLLCAGGLVRGEGDKVAAEIGPK